MTIPDFRTIAVYVLSVLVLVLALSSCQYRRMFKATDFALTKQNNAIKEQNELANRRLVQLTNERDAKQAELDKRAAAQGKTDEKAVDQIEVDDKRQRATPVRVRVHDCTRDAGSGGGRPASEATTTAGARSEDTGEASGVLPQANSRRLADAIKEIEANSAAYSSCRATLIPE